MARADGQKAKPDQGFAMRPRRFAAVIAGARFLLDTRKTEQFFRMTDAIDGARNEENFQRYLTSPVGCRLEAEGVHFSELFARHDWLAAKPDGSLARAYVAFLKRERLSAEGLFYAESLAKADALGLDAARRRYLEGGIALHDVYHVVTGFGRDPVGEACVLAFTGRQFGLRGVMMTATMLALREQLRLPKMPIRAMFKEATAMAQRAHPFPEVDWRDWLDRPLDDVRRGLGVVWPQTYAQHFPDCVSAARGATGENFIMKVA